MARRFHILPGQADAAAIKAANSRKIDDPKETERLMPLSDINDLDDVCRELGIQDSHVTPAEAVRELKAEVEQLRAMADDKITWRPIASAPQQERVLLYAPPENLSDKPDQEPEYRVARAADFCWATLWMKIKPPIKAAPIVKRTTHG